MAKLMSDQHIHAVRARICQVAERQFATHGLEGASMRSIARELGWTAAALYRYFDSKEALLAATRASAHNRFSDRIEAAYASSDDPWERSRAVGKAYIDFAFAEPQAYQLMFAVTQPRDDLPDELIAAEARSVRTVTAYVRDLVEAGQIEGDPELLGRVYWTVIHGLIMLRMAGRVTSEEQFETMRREMMRLITRGAASGRS